MSHTHGPWTYMYDADGDHAIFAGNKMVAITTGAEVVGSREEDEANARLIAAAPAMLEALADALQAIEEWEHYQGSLFEVAAAAREAIAQAKGESL